MVYEVRTFFGMKDFSFVEQKRLSDLLWRCRKKEVLEQKKVSRAVVTLTTLWKDFLFRKLRNNGSENYERFFSTKQRKQHNETTKQRSLERVVVQHCSGISFFLHHNRFDHLFCSTKTETAQQQTFFVRELLNQTSNFQTIQPHN